MTEGLAEVIANADVDCDGGAVVVGEEDIRAVGVESGNRFAAFLPVIEVLVVGKRLETAAAVVLSEFAWFKFDVGVAGKLEEIVEHVANGVVALDDGSTGDCSASDDVALELCEGVELGSFALVRSGSGEIVGFASDADAGAAGTSVASFLVEDVLGGAGCGEAEVCAKVFFGNSSGVRDAEGTI